MNGKTSGKLGMRLFGIEFKIGFLNPKRILLFLT